MILQKKSTMRDFAKERYLAVVKAFPQINAERTQSYFMVSLTFAALSFLGIFAINPTLTTITELNKKLEDSLFVHASLKTKLDNLSSLHSQYDVLSDAWPVVNAAVPDEPNAAYVLGQVQRIANDTGVSIADLEVFQVELTKPKPSVKQQDASYTYSVTVSGSTQQQLQFVQALSQYDRVINIESVMITTEEDTQFLTVLVRTYFTP